jgi:hypothetical protein
MNRLHKPNHSVHNICCLAYLVNQFLDCELVETSVLWMIRYADHTSHSIRVYEHSQSVRTPCPESAIELYQTSDRRLSAKLVPTFKNRKWHVVLNQYSTEKTDA